MIACLLHPRLAPLVLIAVGLGPLAVAYGAEWFLDMHPCHLCLWQRMPYALVAVLGALALALPKRLLLLVWLCVALLAGNAVLAGYHVAVEQHWIQGPSDCSGTTPAGISLEDLKARIEAAPTVRCDEAVPFLGMTMAIWNLILLLGLVGAGVVYAHRLAQRKEA